jgi:hypothetical protein
MYGTVGQEGCALKREAPVARRRCNACLQLSMSDEAIVVGLRVNEDVNSFLGMAGYVY